MLQEEEKEISKYSRYDVAGFITPQNTVAYQL
jgi:hypothetical protein